MLLLDKVKSLELDLSFARSTSSKLDQMLSVQKSPSDKSRLGFVESISVFAPHSTNFVPSSSSEPFVNEVESETVVEGHLWKAQWKEKPNDKGHRKLTMNS